ncbi:MAG: hypothetical protein GY821_14310 [Gammaproteobacteria bacterium]|nr:hypothetical protein [Gammaproteobacteria bacterium]
MQLLNRAKPSHIENHVDYFALMASLSMQQQDYRNAETLYRLLVAQEPLNSTWWAGLGIAADKLGLSMEAHDAFTRANRIGNLPPPLQRYIDNTLRQ